MPGPLGIGGGGGGSGGTVTTPIFPFIDRAVAQTIGTTPIFPFIDRAVAQTIGTTGVQSLTAGTGISVSGTTAPTITNSGVTSIVAGTGITVSGATGAVTVSSSGGSGVTSVTGTAPILSSGGTTPAISIDSTAALTQSNIITGTALKSSGLTGATAASRYVGATASGAPASGTFLLGDFVIDQTGKVYVCTTAGTPGTWTQVGGSAGASAITLIQRQTLSASAASVSFTSIPQTYEMLYLRIYMPGGTATSDSQIKWNNLSGYNSWRVGTRRPYGTTNTGSVDANAVTGFTNTYVSAGVGGSIGSAGSSWFQEMYLPRYTATEGKTITIHTYYGGINGTTGEDVYNTFTGGYNTNTAAITSLTLTALLTYPTGSTFALYGWS